MTLEALRGLVEVRSPINEPVTKPPVIPAPEVGARWGKESDFDFQLPSGGGEEAGGGGGGGPILDDSISVTVEWPDEEPSDAEHEELLFTGRYPKGTPTVKIWGEELDGTPTEEMWGFVSVPPEIEFENVHEDPTKPAGTSGAKVTTTFRLIFTLHPEGVE